MGGGEWASPKILRYILKRGRGTQTFTASSGHLFYQTRSEKFVALPLENVKIGVRGAAIDHHHIVERVSSWSGVHVNHDTKSNQTND